MSRPPIGTGTVWRAAAVWFAVALVLWPFQRRLERSQTVVSPVEGTESAVVERRLASSFDSPFAEPALLVIGSLSNPADDDAGRDAVRRITAPLAASRHVAGLLSPGSSLDTLLIGTDRSTAIAVVGLARGDPDAIDSVRAVVSAELPALRRANPSLTLRWTGQPALVGDLRRFGAAEARRAELRALPVSLVVATLAFGSLIPALFAVGAAALAIVVALGVAGAMSFAVPPSAFTRTLVPLIALALTIDYALFIVRRGTAGAAGASTRRTVLLAAGVVALGFTGLALAPTGELRTAAFAGIVAAAAAAVAAVTLTPPAGGATTSSTRGLERWRRWARWVTDHPWLVLTASVAPLALLAGAATTARLTTPLDQLLPPRMESADAYRDLQRAGRAGAAAELRVLLELPAGTPVFSGTGWPALLRCTAAVRAVPGIADVRSLSTIGTHTLLVARDVLPAVVRNAYVSRDGRSTIIDAFPDVSRGDQAVLATVRALRSLDAAAASGVPGARILVAGLPAYVVDYESALRRALPWIVLGSTLATFLAVLVAFRALVVALKAVALNLVVAAAAIGATVLVFQDGIGAGLLGRHALGSIFPTVPALAFGAAFGTSMDYELFLLGAVREARRAGESDRDAIVTGLAGTGGLITRAAMVMACLFLAFSTSALLPLAMVGFALAVAVVIDATLVRLALAPAILRIAGRWNWWPGG